MFLKQWYLYASATENLWSAPDPAGELTGKGQGTGRNGGEAAQKAETPLINSCAHLWITYHNSLAVHS